MPQPNEDPAQQNIDSSIDAGNLETIDLDASPPRRTSPRKRLIQLVMMTLLIIVTVVGFWYYLTPALKMPPATNIVPGQALIESNASYGTVTLNGKKLAGSPPLVVTLSQGINYLTIDAPPFRPVSCQIEWPPTFHQDTCKGPEGGSPFNLDTHPTTYTFQGKNITPKVVIGLPLLLEHLPTNLQSNALAAIKQSLDQEASALQSPVPIGQYFATGLDAQGLPVARLATAPLQALPMVSQATSPVAINGCATSLCPNMFASQPMIPQSSDGTLWSVVVQTVVGWRFTTAAGNQVSKVMFPAVSFLPLLLSYSPNGGWTVLDPPYAQTNMTNWVISSLCNAGQEILAIADQALPVTESGITGSSIAGCKFSIDLRPADITPTPGTHVPPLLTHGSYLWRFGVLLAADENSHTLLPSLPIAPSAEVDAIGR